MRKHDSAPVTVAIVNDYRAVVEDLRDMLAPFEGRVEVIDTAVGSDDVAPVDVVVFDTLGGQRRALARAEDLVRRQGAGHVVIYAREPSQAFVRAAEAVGVDDVIDKTTTADEDLVEAIEAIAADRAPATPKRRRRARPSANEPSLRDRELIALLALGLSNEQIADELFVGIETVRTHLHHLFQRLGVHNRTQAALRANDFGLAPASNHDDEVERRRRHVKRFQRRPQEVPAARAFVTCALSRLGAEPEEISRFRLVVSELGSNAVMHGSGSIWTVGVQATPDWYSVDVLGGEPERGNMALQPERWTIADPDRPAGRGLGIVTTLMDEVTAATWRGRLRVVCRLRRTTR